MPFWNRTPASGEVPASTVVFPVLEDRVLVRFPDFEVLGSVGQVVDRDLGVILDEPYPGTATQLKVRWQERGGRRLLETSGRVADRGLTEDELLWITELGNWERSDRRAWVRVPLNVRGTVVPVLTQEAHRVTTINVSELAVAVAFEGWNPVEVGDEVRMVFSLDGETFGFGGEISRVRGLGAVVCFPEAESRERDLLRAKVLAATVRTAR